MPARLPQRVLRVLADARSAEAAIDATLAAVAAGLEVPLAMLWLVDERDGMLHWGGDHAAAEDVHALRDLSRRLTFGAGDGLPGRVYAAGVPDVIADLQDDPGFARARAAGEAGLRSAAAAPLVGPEGTIGVIEAYAAGAPPPTEPLEGAARQLAAYLGRVRIEQRLRASEERNEAIVNAALDCVITMDHEGRVVDFNPAAEETFGYSRDEATGERLADLIIPRELREAHHRGLAAYLESGRATILDQRLELTGLRRDGCRFPVELTVTRLGAAEPPMFAGFIRDISERRRIEEEHERLLSEAVTSRALAEAAQARSSAAQDAAEAAGRRLALLARVGERMIAVHEPDEVVREVIDLVVPELADWCGVRLYEPGKPARSFASDERRPADRLLFSVPLRSARGVFGGITFAGLDDEDVAVAESLGARAALAIENARLFAERSHIAETLQRSLLPSRLPAVPGIEVAARYRASGAENLVGGDFYDLFCSADDVWTAFLGDVSGKGPEAAAITALSRHTLRAAAAREPSPKANLALLNDALIAARERDWRFATVVYARLCREGEGLTATVSTGGHLPPLVHRADGTFEDVAIRGTVLGITDRPELHEEDVHLRPGDLMLLYTDGLTEIRPRDPRYGDRLVREVLAAHADAPVEDVAAALERAAVEAQEGEPRDDIALIVLRAPA